MTAGFLVITSYLLLILAFSALAPRINAVFSTERGIFLLHLGSITLLALGLLIYFYLNPSTARATIGLAAIAAHAILSISYLELWSLSEGGYSLQILLSLREKPEGRDTLIDRYADLGNLKRENRLSNLARLGLITKNDKMLKLSCRGRFLAAVLAIILALVNIRSNA